MAIDQTAMYSDLTADREKIRRGITQAISAAKHFCWVSEQDGQITGTLVGLSSDNLWADRQNCIVALWVSRAASSGVWLMKEFLKWVDSRRIIRVAGIVPDTDEISLRSLRLAELLGFRKHGGVYLLYN